MLFISSPPLAAHYPLGQVSSHLQEVSVISPRAAASRVTSFATAGGNERLLRANRTQAHTRKNPVKDWASKNGAKETRTPDPLHAMQVLYQLSYGPMVDCLAFQAWLST